MSSCHRIAGLCATALVAACSSAPPEPSPRSLALSIQAGKIAEECFTIGAGERIDYQFEASTPVDFNFHTHRGKEIVTPVDIKKTRSQAGIFASPRAEDYCMMWSNESAVPVIVKGEWRMLRR